MTIQQVQTWLNKSLPHLESKREAEWLLRHLLGVNRAYLITHSDKLLTTEQLSLLTNWVERRSVGEPLAYILGETEFYGLRFKVTPDVLIPRADTELLVDLALDILRQDFSGLKSQVLDMGTGSGAIAIAIAHNCENCQLSALDLSQQALQIAQKNAVDNQVEVQFQQSNWFSALETQDVRKFHLIVSNPPYIAENDPHLTQTSLPFEPIQALTSGVDGMKDIHQIVAQSQKWLEDQGYLLLEHGYDQALAVQDCLRTHGFSDIQTVKDLGNNDRVTMARYSV